ncbi:MAG: hypothetical protein GY807_12585 [Gammaproteobacteria bacterium]|nr:hypothetical protein [Gammaproteobacteria bacterium]
MSEGSPEAAGNDSVGLAESATIIRVLAEDLLFLASLHEREFEADELRELAAHPMTDRLNILFQTERFAQSLKLADDGLARLRETEIEVFTDQLAADYSDIYLTHKCRAAPTESVWLDEDGLERQQPMFEVRRWYEDFGVSAPNWRTRPDDHIALQLQFVAHLLMLEEPGIEPPRLAGCFLDEHLLVWVDLFASRVAERCSTTFYAGVATLTAAYVDAARELIAGFPECERPAPERRRKAAGPIAQEIEPTAEDGQAYMPGAAPGW